MDPVICIELSTDDIRPLPGFDGETKLLTRSYRFRTRVVLGFCDPDIAKGRDVPGIFAEIPPLNGRWNLELAIELPDLLPTLDAESESVLSVQAPNAEAKTLCLSNRMSRMHFADSTNSYHTLIPRTRPWHGSAQIQCAGETPLPAAEEQLRTMAAMRFTVVGDTPEHAFESSAGRCLDDFFQCINVVLRAVRDARKGFTPVTRTIRRDSVGAVYVLMIGDGRESAAQLTLNAARIGLVSEVLSGEQAKRFRGIVDGSISLMDVDRLLGEARSSFEDGEFEFAFLQAVIAAEITTARAIRTECTNRGVSKNKLDDNRKEMTYSWALNIGLPLCFPPERRPRAELINAMNAARAMRNDLMHEGSFDIGRKELGQILEDTKDYIDALQSASGPRA